MHKIPQHLKDNHIAFLASQVWRSLMRWYLQLHTHPTNLVYHKPLTEDVQEEASCVTPHLLVLIIQTKVCGWKGVVASVFTLNGLEHHRGVTVAYSWWVHDCYSIFRPLELERKGKHFYSNANGNFHSIIFCGCLLNYAVKIRWSCISGNEN